MSKNWPGGSRKGSRYIGKPCPSRSKWHTREWLSRAARFASSLLHAFFLRGCTNADSREERLSPARGTFYHDVLVHFPYKNVGWNQYWKGIWRKRIWGNRHIEGYEKIFLDPVVLSRADWEPFSFIARNYIFQRKNMADATGVKPIFNTSTPLILLLIQVLCRRRIYLYKLNGHSLWSKSQNLLGLHVNCDRTNYSLNLLNTTNLNQSIALLSIAYKLSLKRITNCPYF